ncbi:uncharacterized protein N7484_000890 [Penicillium longicatenatum]|uniref:uncharacterized protein n=1 Tax=Penicillium longicatenatum TaxID=1561947 RepID=UPI0025499A70|nr:uncharacterized protein N7484_000890 [Penicillium longicatenatum]KAJ5657241.1 hypothetical protein N7484_000890 [Penicillium longicatenatum]
MVSIDAMDKTHDNSVAGGSNPEAEAYRPRGYQLEMLEASLKQNIIVAMDTGSGKTQIAILRIMAELEKGVPGKLVWFLAPTVALCLQQHDAIASQIPSVKTRTLTGFDNVDRWTEQSTWNTALQEVRVVVSTHAVLADALSHGFVRMPQLALMVFDEAHHCMRRHPANKIMQNHYHPTLFKFGRQAVPRILGLTASPIVRSNSNELQNIEANLDAVCKTPRTHRKELLAHVHQPRLERVTYIPSETEDIGAASHMLQQLILCVQSYDVGSDPYIQMLRKQPETKVEAEIVAASGKTYCAEQLNKFLEQSWHIYEELGGCATDFFIDACISQLRNSTISEMEMSELNREERAYILQVLAPIWVPAEVTDDANPMPLFSSKFETLLQFLLKMDHSEFSGLIFVRRRITVSVLTAILSNHPSTKQRFRCAAYVGWSNNGGRESIGDLLSRDIQKDTLTEFREGIKNIIVATDVLEESLDVSRCSLVICFDKPSNLKSFVQRRGRARHQESTYAIMTSTDDETLNVQKWQDLERMMVEAYQDDARQRADALALEDIDEDVAEYIDVPSTGARLAAEDALQHLQHFCDLLPRNVDAQSRPLFTFNENSSGFLQGSVTLPSSIHPAVRRAEGKRWWRTERAARQEVAFQAYKALWQYGLVNDNLLPLTKKADLRFGEEKEIPALVECAEQWDPYVELSQAWSSPDVYQTDVEFFRNDCLDEDLMVSIVLPKLVAMPDTIPLYWDPETTLTAKFKSSTPLHSPTIETLHLIREITGIYFQAPSSRLQHPDRDYVVLFMPTVPLDQLQEWKNTNGGTEMLMEHYERDASNKPVGIIRDTAKYSEPRLFRKWIHSEEGTKIRVDTECQSIPRRRNFLQPRTAAEASEDGEGLVKLYVIPAAGCTVDKLPARKSMFGLLISAILDRLEATMVAKRLNDTILKGVGIQNLGHVLTAITTPIAQASTDYQLYEFFGDSVLKFTVACQLFFRQPTWHEGYLSESRDKVVQNKHLAYAALSTGLDSFILAKRFTPKKWTAPFISRKLIEPAESPQRTLSSKVLADVVEALIGAAFLDGGIRKAQACLHRFVPEIDIFTSDALSYVTPIPRGESNLIDTDSLASVIGYKFKDASLLTEALTHPSCEHDTTTQSYQRIEYLGDAVLDMLIIPLLAAHQGKTSQGKMTLTKHSVVNANLLAFFCMGLSGTQNSLYTKHPNMICDSKGVYLWRYLRFNGPTINPAREACLARFDGLRDEITAKIQHGDEYPWEPLTRLRPDKFMSDIMESVLGAIFIDSGGDLDQCRQFMERAGLLPYVRRILTDDVDVVHPRNAAQSLVRFEGNLVFKSRRVEKKGVPATYQCQAILNKEEIALVEGCGSSEEAEVRVAYMVIEKRSGV